MSVNVTILIYLKVTTAHVAPPILGFLAKHPVVDKFDLSPLREIFCAAAPLGDELARACQKRWIEACNWIDILDIQHWTYHLLRHMHVLGYIWYAELASCWTHVIGVFGSTVTYWGGAETALNVLGYICDTGEQGWALLNRELLQIPKIWQMHA